MPVERPDNSIFFFCTWLVATVLAGGVLNSFHQPFQPPDRAIVALAPPPAHAGWRAIHVLSGSCSCSQRVMQHLLARPPLDHAEEQIVVIDGDEPYLEGSRALLQHLADRGTAVLHRSSAAIPQAIGLRGVPLLILVAPDQHVAYLGGYGSRDEDDITLLQQVRLAGHAAALPVLGCAVGTRLRRTADPLHLKY